MGLLVPLHCMGWLFDSPRNSLWKLEWVWMCDKFIYLQELVNSHSCLITNPPCVTPKGLSKHGACRKKLQLIVYTGFPTSNLQWNLCNVTTSSSNYFTIICFLLVKDAGCVGFFDLRDNSTLWTWYIHVCRNSYQYVNKVQFVGMDGQMLGRSYMPTVLLVHLMCADRPFHSNHHVQSV